MLLKQYVVTTGRKPRYLRVDIAKESTSHKMGDYCEKITLQPVVAYNHTMQARVWLDGNVAFLQLENIESIFSQACALGVFWKCNLPDCPIRFDFA